MTVAAVVLVPDTAAALAPADGVPALRRVAQSAWAGGAFPILAISRDPEALRSSLEGLSAEAVAAPAGEPGVAWFVHGIRVAASAVTGTSGGLLWPFRHVWVDPETVTSLVEAHGANLESILRPAYSGKPGFPVLLPASLADRLGAMAGVHGPEAIESLMAAGVPSLTVELGDPGIVYTIETALSELPEFEGPRRSALGGGAG